MLIKFNNDEEVENKILTLFENNKIMAEVSSILYYLLSINWKPIPPKAKQLKEVDEELCEIRIQFWSTLYRINYFVDKWKDLLIILNWYSKPSLYEKSKKKKIEKIINNTINEALILKEQYFLNKWNYESYT